MHQKCQKCTIQFGPCRNKRQRGWTLHRSCLSTASCFIKKWWALKTVKSWPILGDHGFSFKTWEEKKKEHSLLCRCISDTTCGAWDFSLLNSWFLYHWKFPPFAKLLVTDGSSVLKGTKMPKTNCSHLFPKETHILAIFAGNYDVLIYILGVNRTYILFWAQSWMNENSQRCVHKPGPDWQNWRTPFCHFILGKGIFLSIHWPWWLRRQLKSWHWRWGRQNFWRQKIGSPPEDEVLAFLGPPEENDTAEPLLSQAAWILVQCPWIETKFWFTVISTLFKPLFSWWFLQKMQILKLCRYFSLWRERKDFSSFVWNCVCFKSTAFELCGHHCTLLCRIRKHKVTFYGNREAWPLTNKVLDHTSCPVADKEQNKTASEIIPRAHDNKTIHHK